MGIRAERLAGYFFTSSSKRAASWGEKIDIVSLPAAAALLLMHQLPRPCLCCHIHLFLVFAGSQPAGFGEFQHATAVVVAPPCDRCALPFQLKPRITMPDGDPFFAEFHRGLMVTVQAVGGSVAP